MTNSIDPDRFAATDAFLEGFVSAEDTALREAAAASAEAGLPPIAVSPLIGSFLNLLAVVVGARRILEIGVLGGYSAIWLARALPADGHLVGLEIDAAYAELARRNLDRAAGCGDRAEIRVGPALDSLDAMLTAGEPAFDLVFIDADKSSYPVYFERVLRLARPGTRRDPDRRG